MNAPTTTTPRTLLRTLLCAFAALALATSAGCASDQMSELEFQEKVTTMNSILPEVGLATAAPSAAAPEVSQTELVDLQTSGWEVLDRAERYLELVEREHRPIPADLQSAMINTRLAMMNLRDTLDDPLDGLTDAELVAELRSDMQAIDDIIQDVEYARQELAQDRMYSELAL